MSDHHHHGHEHGHDHPHSHADPSSAKDCAHSHAASAIASSGGSDFTQNNREHWDKTAKSYTSEPWQVDIVTRVTAFLRANTAFLGLPSSSSTKSQPIRVLDYACGPGTVTFALTEHATEYVGLDLSDGMVAEYNARVNPSQQSFTAKAQQANLLATPQPDDATTNQQLSGPEYHNFDLVIVGLGFHHFENLPHATRVLADRVKPGGTLAIVDLLSHAEEDNPGDVRKIVAHAGFGREAVKKLFEEAGGLVDVGWEVMDGEILIRGQHARKVFLAKGRKPLAGGGEEKL